MSTRSIIAVKIGDSYKAFYCHYDGYEDGVGSTLDGFYNNRETVEELVNRCYENGIHSLAPDVASTVNNLYPDNDPSKGFIAKTLKEVLTYSDNYGAEYVYVFNKNDEWQYSYNLKTWKKLSLYFS